MNFLAPPKTPHLACRKKSLCASFSGKGRQKRDPQTFSGGNLAQKGGPKRAMLSHKKFSFFFVPALKNDSRTKVQKQQALPCLLHFKWGAHVRQREREMETERERERETIVVMEVLDYIATLAPKHRWKLHCLCSIGFLWALQFLKLRGLVHWCVGACAMTTQFSLQSIRTFTFLLSCRFQGKTAIFDDFPLCPQSPPLKNANFIFVVVSPSVNVRVLSCSFLLSHQWLTLVHSLLT